MSASIYISIRSVRIHSWRNEDLPTRRERRQCDSSPRVAAFDLHFLLSFYGNEVQVGAAARVLGSVVRTIHTEPLLSRERIRQVKNNAVTADPTHYLAEF
jgi:hypothetical protein